MKGIPSVANMMLIGNALNELGLLDVMLSAFGPEKNIVESLSTWAGTADPLAIIDALIPVLIVRMMRKFTGPVRMGPLTLI